MQRKLGQEKRQAQAGRAGNQRRQPRCHPEQPAPETLHRDHRRATDHQHDCQPLHGGHRFSQEVHRQQRHQNRIGLADGHGSRRFSQLQPEEQQSQTRSQAYPRYQPDSHGQRWSLGGPADYGQHDDGAGEARNDGTDAKYAYATQVVVQQALVGNIGEPERSGAADGQQNPHAGQHTRRHGP